jgi:hypothetical protein
MFISERRTAARPNSRVPRLSSTYPRARALGYLPRRRASRDGPTVPQLVPKMCQMTTSAAIRSTLMIKRCQIPFIAASAAPVNARAGLGSL